MTRWIQTLNLVGVAALAGLCTVQWRADGALHRKALALETMRLQQAAKIADQDKVIAGNAADLEDFRKRLERTGAARDVAEEKLRATEAERDELAARREQLQAALEKWTAAVAERDEALKRQGEQASKLMNERNNTVARFNDLAAKYNGLVKDLNDAHAKLAAGH